MLPCNHAHMQALESVTAARLGCAAHPCRVTWGNVNYGIIQTIFKNILLKIAKNR